MTERSNTMTTTTTTTEAIDWEACWSLASRLGAHTRTLLVERDYDAARAWALQMAGAYGQASPANGVRAVSYYELAVLLGHREPEIDAAASLDWNELLPAVEKLAAAVKVKAQDDKAAAEAAARKAAEKEAARKVEEEAARKAAEEEAVEDETTEAKDAEEVSDAV
jgi:signal transduction histidine kinase